MYRIIRRLARAVQELVNGSPNVASVAELPDGPRPTAPKDEELAKLWDQYHEGLSTPGKILATLELVRELHFPTVQVEHQNASTALMRRSHAGYGLRALIPRAHVRQGSPFVRPSEGKIHMKLKKLYRHEKTWSHKQPRRASGTSIWFRGVFQNYQDRVGCGEISHGRQLKTMASAGSDLV